MKQIVRLIALLATASLVLLTMGCEFSTEYDLSVSVKGSGSVSPSGGTYDEGTTVTLTATPSSGWEFSGWSGDVSGSNTRIQVTMNSDKNVTATFTNGTIPYPECTNTLTPGLQTRSIYVGGLSRTYYLSVPRSYDGSKGVPLMLDFHPLMMDAQYEMNNSGTRSLSEQEGFIVAYPQGLDNSWNFGPCCTESRSVDDVGFAMAIIEEIKGEGCINASRIYATGYSNGGGLSHYLACKEADTIAAIAPAAFDLVDEVPCNPSRPISVYMKRGRMDFIVPFNGGASTPPTSYDLDTIHFLGANDTFDEWADINGCSGSPRSVGNNCQAYTDCDGGAEVVLCTEAFGGHSAWDAEEAWDFLKTQTLP